MNIHPTFVVPPTILAATSAMKSTMINAALM